MKAILLAVLMIGAAMGQAPKDKSLVMRGKATDSAVLLPDPQITGAVEMVQALRGSLANAEKQGVPASWDFIQSLLKSIQAELERVQKEKQTKR